MSESHSRRLCSALVLVPRAFPATLYAIWRLSPSLSFFLIPERFRQRSGGTLISARSSLKAAAETCVRDRLFAQRLRDDRARKVAPRKVHNEEPLPLRCAAPRSLLVCSCARLLLYSYVSISAHSSEAKARAAEMAGRVRSRSHSRRSKRDADREPRLKPRARSRTAKPAGPEPLPSVCLPLYACLPVRLPVRLERDPRSASYSYSYSYSYERTHSHTTCEYQTGS